MANGTVILPAYVDEAEARGLVRELKPERDHEFGLMCAVLFGPDGHDKAIEDFTPPFEVFCNAMPIGAKPHITDAFRPGNEAWRPIAESVREQYLSLIQSTKPVVIYTARRGQLARAALEYSEDMRETANSMRKSPIKIVGQNRLSDARIEDELITSLALRLDAFAEEVDRQLYNVKQVDLLFDETDVADRYEATIQRTRQISENVTIVKGWDPTQSTRVAGTISMKAQAPFRLNTQFIGGIHVVGKAHPLILAADIVTNHLAHHLKQLPASSPLNAPSSVENWVLKDRLWGVMSNATEDLF